MKKMQVVRTILTVAVGVGAGVIATAFIKGITPNVKSQILKVCVVAGGICLAGAAAEAAADYAGAQFDEITNYLWIFKTEETLKGERAS